MERDGLLRVADDRHLALSETGRTLAMRVMRKYRLAECLLVVYPGRMRHRDINSRSFRHVLTLFAKYRFASVELPSWCHAT
jgi:Mn-dependent DtxR family transcriptional regulator